jgi:hypothetical protein
MAFRRSTSCGNLFDMCIKTCVSLLRKEETSLSEREALVESVYDGTRKSFENAIMQSVRDPRLSEFTSCHLKQFKCYSHFFPLLCSDERSSLAENIIIAYGNSSLIKLINKRTDPSGLVVYMDLECMQSIIQSLEFNPICTKKSYLPLSDSDTLTPLVDCNSPTVAKYERPDYCSAQSCCNESSIYLSGSQDTGKLLPSKQPVVTYVLENPWGATVPIVAPTTNPESEQSILSVESKPFESSHFYMRAIIIILAILTSIALLCKLK